MVRGAIDRVRAKILDAALRAGRDPSSITLVAVSKTKPVEMMRQACEAGQRAFGENYVQEMLSKMPHLPPDAEWHFVGHLQRNKVKYILGKVKLLHSLDNIRLAREIENRGRAKGIVTDALLEINLSGEGTKFGLPPDGWEDLLGEVIMFEYLRIRGFMTMPPFFEDGELSRPYFRKLKEIGERARALFPQVGGELSMGMTQDYEVAVEEGATILRVGTAIFGERDRKT